MKKKDSMEDYKIKGFCEGCIYANLLVETGMTPWNDKRFTVTVYCGHFLKNILQKGLDAPGEIEPEVEFCGAKHVIPRLANKPID